MKSEAMVRAKLAKMQDIFIGHLKQLGFSARDAELYRDRPERALAGRTGTLSSEEILIVMKAMGAVGAIIALQDILGER